MSDTPLEKSEEKYNVHFTLEELKFLYMSCIENLLQMDDQEFYHDRSVIYLQTCVKVFNELERLDPNWLISNGFAYDKGFHISWLEWFHTLRDTEENML